MPIGTTVMLPLLIERYLQKYSSQDQPLSITKMQKLLEETGRKADRRTIYTAMEALKESGVQIHMVRKNHQTGYYMENSFSKEEIFLLCSNLSDSSALSPSVISSIQDKVKGLLSEE